MIKKGTVEEAKRLALYAGISRCSSQNVTNWGCKYAKILRQSQLRVGDGLGVELFSTYSDNKTKTRYYVYIDHFRKEIVIVFRCCCNLKNTYLCMKGSLVKVQLAENVNVRIHNGISRCWKALKVGYNQLIKFLANDMYPDYKIVLTGYSMGGPLSVLAAIDLIDNLEINQTRIKVYTYGCPRFGNKALADYINQKDFTLARVVNADDVMTHLGVPLFGYMHHNNEILVDKSEREEYFERLVEFNYSSDSLKSSSSKSSNKFFYSISDHYSIWGLTLTHKCL